MKLKIGMALKLRPSICVDTLGRTVLKPMTGTVVYINEPHRYFTAEFHFPNGGHFRESFKFYYKSDLLTKAYKPNERVFQSCKNMLF